MVAHLAVQVDVDAGAAEVGLLVAGLLPLLADAAGDLPPTAAGFVAFGPACLSSSLPNACTTMMPMSSTNTRISP